MYHERLLGQGKGEFERLTNFQTKKVELQIIGAFCAI